MLSIMSVENMSGLAVLVTMVQFLNEEPDDYLSKSDNCAGAFREVVLDKKLLKSLPHYARSRLGVWKVSTVYWSNTPQCVWVWLFYCKDASSCNWSQLSLIRSIRFYERWPYGAPPKVFKANRYLQCLSCKSLKDLQLRREAHESNFNSAA